MYKETLQILRPFLLVVATLLGVCIGSYSNVVIFRYGTDESPNKGRSHCMSCGHKLAWYDNVPLFSYLFLKGRCRYCKEKISIQYPLVEMLNGLLYFASFSYFGFTVDGLLYALLSTMCLVISIVDERTYKIPKQFTNIVAMLGVTKVVANIVANETIVPNLVGMVSISSVLFLLYFLSAGKAMGMGDVRMMFGCGLIVGFPNILVGFLLGCVLVCVVHLARMKFGNCSNKLSFGPYLAIGVLLSAYIGTPLVDWYLKMAGL